MKAKSIILSGLLLAGVGAATTSCEDMFTAENKLVTTDLAPQDTVYQVMGIIQRMQKLADRTVLLGEIRADLVDVDPSVASTDLQQLSFNNISEDNVYNRPADYYAVINSCNIYLAYVDSLYKTHGEYYYEKEICGVKGFRAWCYLELAKIYGNVPLVTEPILTAGAAEKIVASGEKADIVTILDFCIEDLQKYPYMSDNNALRPAYGGNKDNTYNGIAYSAMFIPVRALLAELYLWRGTATGSISDYKDAVRLYHDYFCFPGEEKAVGNYRTTWMDRDHNGISTSYANKFSSVNTDMAGVLPLDTVAYYGNTSDLRMIFNSQYSNNYYPWAIPSQRVRDISRAQDYCYYEYLSDQFRDTIVLGKDLNDYPAVFQKYVGDTRFGSVYETQSNIANSKYNADLSPTITTIEKWLNGGSYTTDKKVGYVPYFRNTILYLHMAEALNRAGFPETAFAVLKYGLSYDVMNNRDIISADEFYRLCEIKSYGFFLQENKYIGAEVADTANNSFVIWRSNVFDNPNKEQTDGSGLDESSGAYLVQIGIHSIGSGDTEYDVNYRLDNDETLANVEKLLAVPDTFALPRKPTAEDTIQWLASVALRDSVIAVNEGIAAKNAEYLATPEVREVRQAHVAKLILEEEALEGAFEGLRFYDIMRYQMQEGKFTNLITLPDHVAEKYGPTPRMEGKPWYLTLPTR